MNKKIYVGNLPFTTTEADLRSVFERHGSVDAVNVISDRETGRPRGFAFVEMNSKADADAAIRALDGSDLDGRAIKVNEAKERPQRSGGFDGGSGHRGGGGGGGGRGGGGGGGGGGRW